VFATAQFGQGWVVEVAAEPDADEEPALGAAGLFASGEGPIGAPHVSQ